jgi:hypothetical protein
LPATDFLVRLPVGFLAVARAVEGDAAFGAGLRDTSGGLFLQVVQTAMATAGFAWMLRAVR